MEDIKTSQVQMLLEMQKVQVRMRGGGRGGFRVWDIQIFIETRSCVLWNLPF